MTEINKTPGQNIFSSLDQSGQAKGKNELGQEDFLKLLITQMSFQDPINPQDSGEFLGQMAQFGTVDGISQLNQTVSNLTSQFYSNQALQASSLVGRKVSLPSELNYLSSKDGMQGSIELASSVQNLQVTVKSPQGEIIRKIELGSQEQGSVDFKWNGFDDKNQPVQSGIYKIEAQGNIGSKNVALPTLAYANVDSVTLGQGDGNVLLNLDGLGTARLDDVTKIA